MCDSSIICLYTVQGRNLKEGVDGRMEGLFLKCQMVMSAGVHQHVYMQELFVDC